MWRLLIALLMAGLTALPAKADQVTVSCAPPEWRGVLPGWDTDLEVTQKLGPPQREQVTQGRRQLEYAESGSVKHIVVLNQDGTVGLVRYTPTDNPALGTFTSWLGKPQAATDSPAGDGARVLAFPQCGVSLRVTGADQVVQVATYAPLSLKDYRNTWASSIESP